MSVWLQGLCLPVSLFPVRHCRSPNPGSFSFRSRGALWGTFLGSAPIRRKPRGLWILASSWGKQAYSLDGSLTSLWISGSYGLWR